jgi:hypothetical protein
VKDHSGWLQSELPNFLHRHAHAHAACNWLIHVTLFTFYTSLHDHDLWLILMLTNFIVLHIEHRCEIDVDMEHTGLQITCHIFCTGMQTRPPSWLVHVTGMFEHHSSTASHTIHVLPAHDTDLGRILMLTNFIVLHIEHRCGIDVDMEHAGLIKANFLHRHPDTPTQLACSGHGRV